MQAHDNNLADVAVANARELISFPLQAYSYAAFEISAVPD